MSGLLIAIEGIDGSGKTTLANAISAGLTQARARHILTREPGGSALGKRIRELLLDTDHHPDPHTELLLYAADRAQHVHHVIRPALDRGLTVITDRYTASTIAYQHHGRGLPLHTIKSLNRFATSKLEPDLTLLLDLHPDQARERTGVRPIRDRLEQEGEGFLHRARAGFLRQAENDPTWITLDATHEPHANEVLALQLIQRLRARPKAA